MGLCLVFCVALALAGMTPAAAAEPTLQEGDSGDEVLTLQAWLWETGDLPVEPTGYFGPLTATAVTSFQARHGLTPDAVADAGTMAALRSAVQPTAHTVAPGDTLSALAARYDVPLEDLVAYNELDDPDLLVTGETVLLVPPSATVSAPAETAAAAEAPAPAANQQPAAPGGITLFGGGNGQIALTFNDGPHPAVTPRVLDLLREAGVKATFFVVGDRALAHPELVRRMVAEGHELASHGHSHRELTGLDAKELRLELSGPRRVAEGLGLPVSPWFRPPGGKWDDGVLQAAGAEGLRLALWTNIGPQHLTAPLLSRRALAAARPGAVLLLHDTRQETVEALPDILSGLAGKGLRAVTLSQLPLN